MPLNQLGGPAHRLVAAPKVVAHLVNDRLMVMGGLRVLRAASLRLEAVLHIRYCECIGSSEKCTAFGLRRSVFVLEEN